LYIYNGIDFVYKKMSSVRENIPATARKQTPPKAVTFDETLINFFEQIKPNLTQVNYVDKQKDTPITLETNVGTGGDTLKFRTKLMGVNAKYPFTLRQLIIYLAVTGNDLLINEGNVTQTPLSIYNKDKIEVSSTDKTFYLSIQKVLYRDEYTKLMAMDEKEREKEIKEKTEKAEKALKEQREFIFGIAKTLGRGALAAGKLAIGAVSVATSSYGIIAGAITGGTIIVYVVENVVRVVKIVMGAGGIIGVGVAVYKTFPYYRGLPASFSLRAVQRQLRIPAGGTALAVAGGTALAAGVIKYYPDDALSVGVVTAGAGAGAGAVAGVSGLGTAGLFWLGGLCNKTKVVEKDAEEYNSILYNATQKIQPPFNDYVIAKYSLILDENLPAIKREIDNI